MVAAGSGPSSSVLQTQAGIPESVAREVITVPFNDINAYKEQMNFGVMKMPQYWSEPIVGNLGMVMPQPGFLKWH